MRKDDTPYLAHLLSVSALVIENGGSEDEAIAGLIHDAIEDAGVSPEVIASQLGQSITDLVLELSEPKGDMPWRERKLVYIRQIREGSRSAVLVSLADKTHNTLAYLKGARIKAKDGSQSKTEQTLWFLGELAAVYRDRLPNCYLVQVLERAFQELKLLGWGYGAHC
jgi:(p)ppGpp synthase/HD superfamily hydrolase